MLILPEQLGLFQKCSANVTAVPRSVITLAYLPLPFSLPSDNIDTRSSLEALRDLVSACNTYLDESRLAGAVANRQLLGDAARYVTRMLRVFGAVPGGGPDIGFPLEGETATDVSQGGGF